MVKLVITLSENFLEITVGNSVSNIEKTA